MYSGATYGTSFGMDPTLGQTASSRPKLADRPVEHVVFLAVPKPLDAPEWDVKCQCVHILHSLQPAVTSKSESAQRA
jgi:hypothetical protein